VVYTMCFIVLLRFLLLAVEVILREINHRLSEVGNVNVFYELGAVANNERIRLAPRLKKSRGNSVGTARPRAGRPYSAELLER
jgi:hypothetical protein